MLALSDLTKKLRPIMTYRAQGTNKNGVRANHHAIIYTEQPNMMYGEGERGLTRRPIRVIPSEPQHKLDPASRLNYAKIYTVEHNVKVWFIGKLAPESQEPVVTDYNQVNPPLSLPSFNIPVATGSNVSYAQGGSSNSSDFGSAPHGNRGYYSTPAGTTPNQFYPPTTLSGSGHPSYPSQVPGYNQQYPTQGNSYGQTWSGDSFSGSYPSESHQNSSADPSNAADEQSEYYDDYSSNNDRGS
jgi:hypothetical protein